MKPVTIGMMYTKLEYGARKRKKFNLLEILQIDPKDDSNKETRHCEYLNRLSHYIRAALKIKGKGLIHFISCAHNAPSGHPTGKKIHPDLVGVRKESDDAPDGPLYWSALEATGMANSRKHQATAQAQGLSYTGFLLQARPDYTSVQGIYVQAESFKLVVTNACGAFCTELLRWEEPPSYFILCAWISRLYTPAKVDRSINLDVDSDGVPSFNIKTIEKMYNRLSVRSVGSAFGRRTIVLADPETDFVIKEQYIEASHRYQEGPVLEMIHQGGVFPGVVRIVSYEVMELAVDHEDELRRKFRLVMMDKAGPLMDAKTPRDALVAVYDLLEVTRFLHRKRSILHRDISSNNVLLQDDIKEIPQPFAQDLEEMCFASFLLKQKSSNHNVGRLHTRVLLIDFDMGEDKMSPEEGRDPTPRTGTPIFMALPVRSPARAVGIWAIPPMPQMNEGRKAYESYLRDRLEAFPQNEEEIIRNRDPKWPSGFRRRLQYDAESVFWLLVYWATLACPEYDSHSEYRFEPLEIWRVLTGGGEQSDTRSLLLNLIPLKLTHPDYGALRPLLQDIADQIRIDTDLSTDPQKKNEEYLHEVMQRLILEVLFKNYDADFLNLKKSPLPRQLEQQPEMQMPLSSGQIETSRSHKRSEMQTNVNLATQPKSKQRSRRPPRQQNIQASANASGGQSKSKRKRADALGDESSPTGQGEPTVKAAPKRRRK